MSRSAKLTGFALLLLITVTVIIWYAVIREDNDKLIVSFLNIGQGDAIFIESPSGRQMLIDGGPSRVVLRELAKVMPWWDRTIDVVEASHPDQDHIGGLPDVFARYKVDLIVESSVKDEGGTDSKALEEAAASEGGRRLTAHRGDVIDLGEGVHVDVLSPDRDVPNVETNLGCVVTRVVYGATAFMLSCDAPDEIENYLVSLDGKNLKSSVLKAGHHGSKTSSSPDFIRAVAPQWVVFSRGCDNKYGHPHPDIVARYKEFKIPALDTCTDGRVTFVSDGQTVRLQ